MSTYTILGASGHTGQVISHGLLKKGHTVRIVSRDPAKAKELIDLGANHFHTSLTDVEGLKKAFSGSDAAYLLIPGDVRANDIVANQMGMVDSIAKALEGSGIRHAVTLSSVGAHLEHGAGIVQGLQKMEEKFDALPDIHMLHLRATYFLENTLAMAGMAKHMGIIGSPVIADLKVPMVAAKDIGEVALKRLLALGFSGKGHEYVLGHRDYSYDEIAKIYGKAIGKPDLKYVQFPYEDAKKAMVQMGLGESYVDQLLEFVKGINEGKVLSYHKRNDDNTTSTSAEDFSKVFKAVYEQS